jgi:hypothetical protein
MHFEKQCLGKLFGPEDMMKSTIRKLPSIIKVIKCVSWHVAGMGEVRILAKICPEGDRFYHYIGSQGERMGSGKN